MTLAPLAVLVLPLVIGAIGYAAGLAAVGRRSGDWSFGRTAFWYAGLAVAAYAVTGPVATAGHHDFTAHMTGHLLLGMAAPLLLVLGAPVTLALRALPVRPARVLSRVLRSGPVRTVSHPVSAAVLNAGGLWALYTTGLYPAMHHRPELSVLVHLHVLVAGYLVTAAVIGVDPAPHRPGRGVRAAVLIGYLAAHGILAKYLYAHPPAGVPASQAEDGAMLMYYGGDLIDLGLIIVFCMQWYVSGHPRERTPRNRWRLRANGIEWEPGARLHQ